MPHPALAVCANVLRARSAAPGSVSISAATSVRFCRLELCQSSCQLPLLCCIRFSQQLGQRPHLQQFCAG
eukprot:12963768-Ditylum_brightwellii.AAC.1